MIKTFAWILTLILISCSSNSQSQNSTSEGRSILDQSEILFELRTTDPDYLESFPDGIIPWISIQNAAEEVDMLIGKNDLVLSSNSVLIIIDYPVNEPFEIEIKSDGTEGFTRSELILKISEEYKRIYKEEEESASIKTIPTEDRNRVVNRNETNGKYGIWGHDLIDLDLAAIVVHRESGQKPKLELYIES
ncbi:MAG: hypothetical protein HRT58_19660 [Crocinitomicaceae bacterium]|nr:hypothetical protein [Flavobacteriales bacterium]NQZ37887.1 hypothetical protein [Crocinitomicaceae bacterium]